MRNCFFILSVLFSISARSINVAVRIYASDNIKAIILAPKAGKYLLLGDGKSIDTVTSSSVYEIEADENVLEIKNLTHDLGKFTSIKLKKCSPDCIFNIKHVSEKIIRQYNDELVITCNDGYLKMLNIVQFEHYIAGVVECEAGQKRSVEFYKAQAVICRTYALNNMARHLIEDFELCDMVHCQVYKGTADVPEILQAVEDTKGLVIVDSADHLINAAYHSNCGGYTVNSEDAWSMPLSYLKAVKDTFCLHQFHATWEKHYSLNDWASYLEKKESSLTKKDIHEEAFWDSVPVEKRVFYYDKGFLIPLKDMRVELNLRSTYFTVLKDTTGIILEGRGNGHRVGFCQEGAIRMAQLGYNYQQMLHFYYTGVQVIDSATLPVTEGTN
jgi:stage II sporulation protein D